MVQNLNNESSNNIIALKNKGKLSKWVKACRVGFYIVERWWLSKKFI